MKLKTLIGTILLLCVFQCSAESAKQGDRTFKSHDSDKNGLHMVAKNLNHNQINYGEIFPHSQHRNEVSSPTNVFAATKQYEHYKLLSIKLPCIVDTTNSDDSSGEILSDGHINKHKWHATKYENILHYLQNSKYHDDGKYKICNFCS